MLQVNLFRSQFWVMNLRSAVGRCWLSRELGCVLELWELGAAPGTGHCLCVCASCFLGHPDSSVAVCSLYRCLVAGP